MKAFLDTIRAPVEKPPLRRVILTAALTFALGLMLGAGAKLLDLRTNVLGDIFSQMSVWILIGTALAVYSVSPKQAAINVFLCCAGMLITYYLTAALTGSIWSITFARGWAIFALFCPLFAAVAWYAGGRGPVAAALAAGIVIVTLLAARVLFDRVRFQDWLIAAAVALLLFRKGQYFSKHHQSSGKEPHGRQNLRVSERTEPRR